MDNKDSWTIDPDTLDPVHVTEQAPIDQNIFSSSDYTKVYPTVKEENLIDLSYSESIPTDNALNFISNSSLFNESTLKGNISTGIPQDEIPKKENINSDENQDAFWYFLRNPKETIDRILSLQKISIEVKDSIKQKMLKCEEIFTVKPGILDIILSIILLLMGELLVYIIFKMKNPILFGLGAGAGIRYLCIKKMKDPYVIGLGISMVGCSILFSLFNIIRYMFIGLYLIILVNWVESAKVKLYFSDALILSAMIISNLSIGFLNIWIETSANSMFFFLSFCTMSTLVLIFNAGMIKYAFNWLKEVFVEENSETSQNTTEESIESVDTTKNQVRLIDIFNFSKEWMCVLTATGIITSGAVVCKYILTRNSRILRVIS
ncbi:hypothetical protein NEIRO02_0642 [Nematocida sp. AWRm79]|nr:hypothetical protein NEIRO02_0642 [Nematocida sp. AWRm79]